MKKTLTLVLFFVFGVISGFAQLTGYDLNNIVVTSGSDNPISGITEMTEDEFTNDISLDIVNWNVNWLGAPQMISSKYGTRQEHIDGVAEKLVEIDADIYALQEVVVDVTNGNALDDLVTKMNELAGSEVYAGSYSTYHSFYWNDDDPDYPPQCLAYVWKKQTVAVNESKVVLKDYASGSDFGYGRLPYLLDVNVTLNGKTQRYMLFNIHLKASSGYRDMRASSMRLMKELLRVNYADNNVILLGDYNVADASGALGEIKEWEMYNDEDGDGIADYVHAAGNKNNGIEHTLISNDLFDELAYTPDYFRNQAISGTGVKLSDHYAYQMRLYVHEELGNIDPKNDALFADGAYEFTMTKADYQIIVSYVKDDATLSALDDSKHDDSEYYFGSSSYYSNFDIRDGKHHSTFETWQDAVKAAINSVLLPAKFPNAEKNDAVYKVTFDTYSGKNGTSTFNFECTKSAPDPEFAYTTRTDVLDMESITFNVFPNPVSDMITIENDQVVSSYSIINQMGKVLIQNSTLGAKSLSIDLTELKNGLYLIRIEQENGLQGITRFVKQ